MQPKNFYEMVGNYIFAGIRPIIRLAFAFYNTNAKVAQLVEHDLAKVGVASSNLVFRSKPSC